MLAERLTMRKIREVFRQKFDCAGQTTIKLIETGNIVVDAMITHRIPLKDIAKGFQLVLEGRASIKVIIKPNF